MTLGAEVCRCHDCRARQAWFGLSLIPLGNRDPDAPSWSGVAAISSGVIGLALICWIVKIFAERAF